MASDLTKSFAIYPMVEEGEATGRVAAVYSEILRSMPFVPSLFKSFAVCPAYLVMAWDQASHALRDDAFLDAAEALSREAGEGYRIDVDVAVGAAVERFVGPLGRMLLLSAGLLLAAEGELEGAAASAAPPSPGDGEPEQHVASQWDVDAWRTYGDIRAQLETPIVNSIWRLLAQEGVLADGWAAVRAHVPATRRRADALQRLAVDRARSLRWSVVADPASLGAAGAGDALPALTSVLDAYVKTLPRVLALAAPAAPR